MLSVGNLKREVKYKEIKQMICYFISQKNYCKPLFKCIVTWLKNLHYIFNLVSWFFNLALEHKKFPIPLYTICEHHFNSCIIFHHIIVLNSYIAYYSFTVVLWFSEPLPCNSLMMNTLIFLFPEFWFIWIHTSYKCIIVFLVLILWLNIWWTYLYLSF